MVRKISGKGTRKRKAATGKRRPSTRRRRRISGIGSMDVKGIATKIAGLTVGAALARELNAILVKQFPSLTPMISGFIQIAAGVFVPILVKGNSFVADMGMGMIANGGMVELVNFGVISGVRPDRMSYQINGSRNLSAIAGGRRFHAIAGSRELSPVAGMGNVRKRTINKCF